MRVRLALESGENGVAVLRATTPLSATSGTRTLRYRTRTGALLRIGGIARGAFDGEHEAIVVPATLGGSLSLEVERRALPGTGLPPTGGLRWRRILARAEQEPARTIEISPGGTLDASRGAGGGNGEPKAALAVTGHSHLDVAWLWTYDEGARKAVRTFATAVRQLELSDAFVFAQSQPQLYAYVRALDPQLFERVANFARVGRFDASGAAMWVESDCNLPSGESLLRQLVFGMRFAETHLGTTPSVAWLPDSFGFANTLPSLLRHAGVGAFATTKLGWNDTTAFPYAQFVWEGPDGASVLAAQIASIEGGFKRSRVARARRRGDVLLAGRGDGGGGASDATLREAPRDARWTTLGAWFARIGERRARLPVWRDELYLEEHRGTATTHHDVKARAAGLERALRDAEEALAWAYALRATPFFVDEARRQLDAAWEIVLRAQFHDVLPGTATAEAFAQVRTEFDRADALVAHVSRSATSILPSAALRPQEALAEPVIVSDGFTLANDSLHARIGRDGTFTELRARDGENLVRRANRLARYVDRPERWDAWNVARSYPRRERSLRATGCDVVDGALEVRYAFGASLAVSRISLTDGEAFVRVETAVAWNERHTLLRCENELAFGATRARFGSPHGTVERTPRPRTAAERAKFEAPGQRFALLDGPRASVAMFSLDTYGWSLGTRGRRTRLGHSLLRGPTWPDPSADRGEHALAYAFAPLAAAPGAPADNASAGALERLWERFAGRRGVAMFVPDDPRVVVVATKLADDGAGVILRARECDGAQLHEVRFACGVRALDVTCVDALERPLAGEVRLHEAAIVARFAPFELRSFRVRLR